MSSCVICGRPRPPGRMTCGRDDCHEKFVAQMETEFGHFKKVVDVTTGKVYRVPTRDIIERGLRFQDLPNYPEWKENLG